MESIDILTIDEFETITKYPFKDYLRSFDFFVKNNYNNIISYYSGNTKALDAVSFANLSSLIDETQRFFSVFSSNKNHLLNYKFWILIDTVEKIDNALQMVDNSSKWLRSTVSKGNFNPNPEIDVAFNQGQTLESIERDILGSNDYQNSWVDLAIKNDLREEDYTSEGGFLIKANFENPSSSFKITSIVDNPVGEKVLGLDLDKRLNFADDDLATLQPKDTFMQNVSILINLRIGDNPEFNDQGINPSLVVGSNINSISYPVLFRQLSALFKADDTIKSFTINNINRDQDAVYLDFNVQSRLNDVQNISLIV